VVSIKVVLLYCLTRCNFVCGYQHFNRKRHHIFSKTW